MSTPLRCLLVEDSDNDAELLLGMLRQNGFALSAERVQTAAAMGTALAARDWDIIVCDYAMPGFDGAAALHVLRESGRDVPLIIVSGTIGEELAVETIKLGATDYLLKDRLGRLGPAVQQAIAQRRLRRERATVGQELRLFRALMDHSNDALEVIDPATGNFLDVNETECIVLGYSRAELLGLGVPDIDPTVRAVGWEKMAAAIRQAGSLTGEGCHQRKDGASFPVEFNARWVHLERDYIVTVVRDISQRKLLEEDFRLALRQQSAADVGLRTGLPLFSGGERRGGGTLWLYPRGVPGHDDQGYPSGRGCAGIAALRRPPARRD